MALPGFIEYLFYGFEDKNFFNQENLESFQAMDIRMAEEEQEGGGQDNEASYEQEVLGYDTVTGREFTRIRKRKPLRYFLPGLIGGCKN